MISIVIPFHNEAGSLPILIDELQGVLDQLSQNRFEVLMVNDCSTDGGELIVKEVAALDPRFNLLQMSKRGGQTGAFKLAFAHIQGDYVVRMDCDLQDDPKDLPKLLERVDQGYDLIMGVREGRKHSIGMVILTRIYDFVTGTIFRTRLRSHSGSFIAFRTPFVKDIPFQNNDHRYLPLIAMRRGALKRISIPVTHRERQFGKSKYRILGKALFGFYEVGRFYFRYAAGYYDFKTAAVMKSDDQPVTPGIPISPVDKELPSHIGPC